MVNKIKIYKSAVNIDNLQQQMQNGWIKMQF